MSVEDLRTLPPGSDVAADVCVVGSGPAGFTIATELAGRGRIVMLESGGRESDGWASSLNEIVSVGAPRVLDQSLVRTRALGGSSAVWGGRLATLGKLDFEARAWVAESGWPIPRAALEPYFARAAARLGSVIIDNLDPVALAIASAALPHPSPDLLEPYVWSYSRHDGSRRDHMRFGPLALAGRLGDVICFTHATLTQIETDASARRVRRLEVRGRDGQVRWITARHVVLCAGGIENARLLLTSNRVVHAGLGNQRDLVGRFLMDHLRGPTAWYEASAELRAQRVFGDRLLSAHALPLRLVTPGAGGRGQLSLGYALSRAVQERERLLNCAVFVKGEPAPDDPLDAALALAHLHDPARNTRALLRHPVITAAVARQALAPHRFPPRVVTGLSLQCIVEQPPRRDSRITLDRRTDALGTPLARIDWRIGAEEARSVRRITELFVNEMRRLGLPAPLPVAMIAEESSEFFLPEVAHPTGTTRMSSSAEDGVVDTDCRVHGVDGLYVAGSSVFPTSGHANPTQSIVALAIRLADHLKPKLGPPAVGPVRLRESASPTIREGVPEMREGVPEMRTDRPRRRA